MNDTEQAITVLVENPRGSRNTYRYDHQRGVIRLDRRLFSATVYPADLGFIPETLADDGGPLDALILLEDPTFPGCRVRVRPVGVLRLVGEARVDTTIVCVPASESSWRLVRDLDDLPGRLLDEIAHFYEIYLSLGSGSSSWSEGFGDVTEAWRAIERARQRHHERATGDG